MDISLGLRKSKLRLLAPRCVSDFSYSVFFPGLSCSTSPKTSVS